MYRFFGLLVLFSILQDAAASPPYCPPTYHQPAAAVHATYPLYGDWSYNANPDGTYTRWRWAWSSQTTKAVETDPRLYTKTHEGAYVPYHPQIGQTVYGVSPAKYRLGLELGLDVGKYAPPTVLKQLGEHKPLDAREFLPQIGPATDSEAAGKALSLAIKSKSETDRAAIDANKALQLAQLDLARHVATFQAYDKEVARRAELFAVFAQRANVSATGEAAGVTLPITDQALHAIVAGKCYQCHGGREGVKGGVDFRQPLTAEVWLDCLTAVCSGEMPKGGQPLDKQEIQLFKAAAKTAGR